MDSRNPHRDRDAEVTPIGGIVTGRRRSDPATTGDVHAEVVAMRKDIDGIKRKLRWIETKLAIPSLVAIGVVELIRYLSELHAGH